MLKNVLFCMLFLSPSVSSDIIRFRLVDEEGPIVTGFVDTTLDSATLETVQQSPGSPYWTPTDLPMTLLAVDSSGHPFDVPDIWDGKISDDWMFLAQQRNDQINWLEGTGPSLSTFGWGGAELGGRYWSRNLDETFFVFYPDGPLSSSSPQFETVSMSAVPEPTALLFWLLGVASFIKMRSRRK